MEVRVNKPVHRIVPFNSVKPGNCFIFRSSLGLDRPAVLMVIVSSALDLNGKAVNAVRLSDGYVAAYCMDAEVVEVEVDITASYR